MQIREFIDIISPHLLSNRCGAFHCRSVLFLCRGLTISWKDTSSAGPSGFLNTALARGKKTGILLLSFPLYSFFFPLTWWNCRLWVWWRGSTHTKMVFGSFWITWLVSEREGPLLASSGTALERLLLCGKHYDIMQVDLIDLMEHADMVSQALMWWEAGR